MDLKHKLLVVEESFLFGVHVQMLKKLLGYEGLTAAWVTPNVNRLDII